MDVVIHLSSSFTMCLRKDNYISSTATYYTLYCTLCSAVVTAGFAESGFTVDEFDGFADLTVMLNTPAAQAVMVMVKTVQGTATENQGT